MYVKARVTSDTGTIYRIEYGVGRYSKTGVPRWYTRRYVSWPQGRLLRTNWPRPITVILSAEPRL